MSQYTPAKRKSTLDQEGPGYKVFTVFNTVFLIIATLVTLYPMYYVVVASISEADELARNFGLLLYPLGKWNVFSYELVFRNGLVLSGFLNTFFILFAGLAFNMVLTCLGAYFLSLKGSMLVKPLSMLILFTMYFSGGIVPIYMNVRDLGLMDTLWSLIIPVAIDTYNMLIMRSAFASVPDALHEAAYLDGAPHYKILTQVYIPLSGATLAVMVLYYGVGHWNSWFRASLYISDTKKYPLQLVLRQILLLNQNSDLNASVTDLGELAKYSDSVKYALIVVSSAPILLLYPFLQKFFAKGVMVGALKG
ncbi:MAG: carbohydrate ABC transporter permease [Clostridia bacterium]|nr:carbohydrate ABC transporter permease [Clostridia bacterium]